MVRLRDAALHNVFTDTVCACSYWKIRRTNVDFARWPSQVCHKRIGVTVRGTICRAVAPSRQLSFSTKKNYI